MKELTPECPPACSTLLKGVAGYRPEHASGCIHYVNNYGRAWCKTCRSYRQVVDEDTAIRYSGNAELSTFVQYMECNHTSEGEERITGTSPGGGAAAEAIRERQTQQRLNRAARWNEEW